MYSSGKIDRVGLEELRASMKVVGQIYPVIRNARGEIIDGYHRKRVDPEWREVTLPVIDPMETLRMRVHLNLVRRRVSEEEKRMWILEARRILQENGLKGSQREVAEALGMTRPWVAKYDPEPTRILNPQGSRFFSTTSKMLRRSSLEVEPRIWPPRPLYNVWGFRDDSWRGLVLRARQPRYDFYHGITPAFVVENLLGLYKPRRVLDSMAGVGTTGWVCRRYGVECDQFDLYPFPDGGVRGCDAEGVETGKTYDLIFNHLPYLDMVSYGDDPRDLSNLSLGDYLAKLRRIFKLNWELLEEDGVYAILVGDLRRRGEVIPLTMMVLNLALETGFKLRDMAIKVTGEAESMSGLLQHRAEKYNFMVPCHDTVLILQRREYDELLEKDLGEG